jgi:hypothetical protein
MQLAHRAQRAAFERELDRVVKPLQQFRTVWKPCQFRYKSFVEDIDNLSPIILDPLDTFRSQPYFGHRAYPGN